MNLLRRILVCSSIILSLQQTTSTAAPACAPILNVLGALLETNDTVYTCVGTQLGFEDASLLDGLLLTRTWDFGDGTGAVDGLLSSTTAYTYNMEGSYDLTMTIQSVLCSELVVIRTVIVLGQPDFSTSSQDIDCFGNCNGKAAIAFASINAEYYNVTWDDPSLQENDTAFNLCAGGYMAVISDDMGCTNFQAGPVDVSEPQLLTASIDNGDTLNICPSDGSVAITLSLSGGAGNNQTMTNSSAVTILSPDQLTFSPTAISLDQMCVVTVQDDHGCLVEDSIYLRSTPSSLQGTITMGGNPCANCEVLTYHFNSSPGVWQILDDQMTDASGNYDMVEVHNFQDFIIMADPDDGSYPMAVQTYYPQAYQWEDATVLNVCGQALTKDIALIPPMEFNGTNTFIGTLLYSATGKTQTEDPIPLIDVVVEKTPPGQARGKVTTDAYGIFTFENVPSSDTMYTLFVNMPGVPMAFTYEILASGDQSFSGLDFCLNIDSTLIDTCPENGELVGETQEDVESGEGFGVYPNPTESRFTVSTGALAGSSCVLRIIDLSGRVIFNKAYPSTPRQINMVNMASGFYLVQMFNDTHLESAQINVVGQ